MNILIILLISFIFVTCSENISDSEELNLYPTSYFHSLISFEQIPSDTVSDSLYYIWTGALNKIGNFDTSLAIVKLDSIFTSLMTEKIPLKYAWYQYNDTHCGDLTIPIAAKLYIELNRRDNRCSEYSFTCQTVMQFSKCGTATFRKFVFQ